MKNLKRILAVVLIMSMVISNGLNSFSMNDLTNVADVETGLELEVESNVEESKAEEIIEDEKSIETEEVETEASLEIAAEEAEELETESVENNAESDESVADVEETTSLDDSLELKSEDEVKTEIEVETEVDVEVASISEIKNKTEDELFGGENMSKESYLVYVLNGGYFADNRLQKVEVEFNSTVVLPTAKDIVNLDHFTFEGWYLDEEFTGEKVTSILIDKTGDISVYAKWKYYNVEHILPRDWFEKGYPESDPSYEKKQVYNIEFREDDNIPYGASRSWNIDDQGLRCYEISKNIEGSDIVEKVHVIQIPKGDKLYAPEDSSELFAYFANLQRFINIELIDTRNVVSMEGMFSCLSSIESLDLRCLNTDKLENMRYVFGFCYKLKNLDISTWDTSKVTNMQGVFAYCRSMEVIDVSFFDTRNVTNMSQLFCVDQVALSTNGEYELTDARLREIKYGENFITSNVENMSMMYSGVPMQNIDISMLDTSKVTDMSEMFRKCIYIEYLDLSTFDTSNVENMRSMFELCLSLTSVDFSSFDTKNVYTMERMFECCYAFKTLDISMFEADSLMYMERMFNMNPTTRTNPNHWQDIVHNGKPSLEVIDISGMQFKNPVDMTGTFYGNSELTTVYCSKDIYAASGAYPTKNFSKGKLNTFEGCVKLVGDGKSYNGDIYVNPIGDINDVSYNATPTGYFTVGSIGNVEQVEIKFVNPILNDTKIAKVDKGGKLNYRKDEMTGYTFLYWYSDDENSEFNFDTIINEDLILNSKWTENSYTITYNLNGGAFVDESSIIMSRLYTQEVILPVATDLTRENYIFKNWYTTEDLKGPAVTKIDSKTTDNVVLYAKWEMELDTEETVTVTYVTDKGVTPDPLVIKKGKTAVNYKLGNVEGYSFRCWVKYGTNVQHNFDEAIMKDTKLEAFWDMNSYDVYLNANGGDYRQYHPTWGARFYNESYVLPSSSLIYKPGYTFGGWFEEANFKGSPLTEVPAYTSRDVTVYAKWNPIKNQIHILEKDWFSESNISNFRDSITSIEFLVSEKEPEYQRKSILDNKGMTCYIVRDYVDESKNDFDYKAVVRINPDCQIKTSDDASYLFDGFKNIKKIDNLKILDTSNAENMEYMFKDCEELESIDLSNFDTKQVLSMNSMFVNCTKLKSIDLTSFNTENVSDISYMFSSCESATTINVSSFDTSNVKKMYSLFRNCKSVKTLDVSNFNTENIYDMSYMFAVGGYCYDEDYNYVEKTSELENIIFGEDFNTSKVQTMAHMFEGASVKSLDLSGFDTQNVTEMGCMFEDCVYLETLDLSNFNVEKVKDFRGTFSSCHRLKSIDLSSFNTKSATDMTAMFANCFDLEELDLSAFDTSKLVYADRMFANHGESVFVYEGNVTVKNNNPHSSLKVINLSSFKLTGERIWVDEMFDANYNLETIYATTDFVDGNILYAGPYHTMFAGCTKLVGGNGTKFSAENKGESFACIDTDDTPGYFTDIADKDKIKTYNIEYRLNDGVFVPTYQVVTVANVGEDVILPVAKDMKWTKTGDFRFAGWYDNDEYTGDVLTVLNRSENTDIILYAKWDEYYKLLVLPVSTSTNNLYYNHQQYYITAKKNSYIEIPKNKTRYFSYFTEDRYREMVFDNYYLRDKNNNTIKTLKEGDKYLLTTNDYKIIGTWLGSASVYTYSTIVSRYGKPDYNSSTKNKLTNTYNSSGSSGGSGTGGSGGGSSININLDNVNISQQNLQGTQSANQAPNAVTSQDKAVSAVSRTVDTVVSSANSNWVQYTDGTWALVVQDTTGQTAAHDGFYSMVETNQTTGATTNSVYYFDSQGKMATGWVKDATGNMYFFETANTKDVGKMTTGWKEIAGGYYYFGNDGKMMTNGVTPDGYKVGADGSWTI